MALLLTEEGLDHRLAMVWATGWSAGAWLAGVLALNQEPGGNHTGDAPATRSSLEKVPPLVQGVAPMAPP